MPGLRSDATTAESYVDRGVDSFSNQKTWQRVLQETRPEGLSSLLLGTHCPDALSISPWASSQVRRMTRAIVETAGGSTLLTSQNAQQTDRLAETGNSGRHVQESDSNDVEIFHSVNDIPKTKALVTLLVNNRDQVSFQLDTGASVNILPYAHYVRVTGDKACKSLERTAMRLIMHNKAEVKPLGQAWLNVKRNRTTRKLRFIVVRSKVMPLLSLQSCLGMKLVQILDCDTLNTVTLDPVEMPHTGPPVMSSYQTASSYKVKEDHILREYSDVLDGLGTMPGEYHIQVDPAVPPVVHAPRKVPVALRETVREELMCMVGDGIIAPVTEPTL